MGKTFKLNIVTPDNKNISGEVVSVTTKTYDGSIEILANHADAIVSVEPTVTSYVKEDGTKRSLFTSSGIMYIKNNILNLCCDSANYPEEIDVLRAEAAKERALKRLQSKDNEVEVDVDRAKIALVRALARLALKEY